MDATALQHLPKQQVAQLVQLIQRIVQAIYPVKIICYGYRTCTMDDWSCFFDGDTHNKRINPTYDFLIITNDEEKRAHYEIIEIAEQQAFPMGCDTTIIVQQLNEANKALENGSRFISTVYRKGVMLYNGNGLPLSTPPDESDISVLKNLLEDNWHRRFGMSRRFLKTANYCFDNGWNEQTIFDLHQSVEHACVAIIRVYTGFRPTTHNLSRLLDLICNFSQELVTLFPRQTKEETDLFNTLNRAYSEARYNEKYTVTTEIAKILLGRVTTLLDLAEKFYDRKQLSLESSQPISFPLKINNK
ncbi:HEPN domain-containing protein [Chitinophaga oryziterrae]|uniref:HEPN domain-containing protein n=1 Tax=Chitinophaga oryziterrae TaxID=1031224 RepID=A0A6N8J588_9BACT|nr:HEPN domain-containing protein [Chitinophaga oryziterrae]MVT39379.1 HEPN domain-containing protein [Chitinophaga oryziterrae]